MRDQPALRIYHISVAALAHFDLRDHVPDQLEVHLGHAHSGVAPGPAIASVMYGCDFTAKQTRPW